MDGTLRFCRQRILADTFACVYFSSTGPGFAAFLASRFALPVVFARAVAGFSLFRGASWARGFVGVIAVLTVMATIAMLMR